jgi:hypothetical protein
MHHCLLRDRENGLNLSEWASQVQQNHCIFQFGGGLNKKNMPNTLGRSGSEMEANW